ncbi:hypothetical protein FE810_13805 [Thalassotalea litorea]|uniref:Uncharacterized protein n=1 Tax=Thalassotalea litorea TaxID=2020715 RepID=A0A5R9IE41_9GAMM|nr:hypothetical protein [Thalassotalea litorea]TLU61886.1 hypothetical protein FE810_13805 [Thalassotalea litorea]
MQSGSQQGYLTRAWNGDIKLWQWICLSVAGIIGAFILASLLGIFVPIVKGEENKLIGIWTPDETRTLQKLDLQKDSAKFLKICYEEKLCGLYTIKYDGKYVYNLLPDSNSKLVEVAKAKYRILFKSEKMYTIEVEYDDFFEKYNVYFDENNLMYTKLSNGELEFYKVQ